MSETAAEVPAAADVPVASVTVPASAEAPAPAAEPAAAVPAEPSGKDELAKLLAEARAHLSGGIPQSAVETVIRAVELLAGL